MTDADQIGRMLNKQPSIVSYRSVEDLVTLKDWLYNFNDTKDNRVRAIQRIKALNSRGRIPHAIESTGLLTSICVSDPSLVPSSTDKTQLQNDSNILQLSYSMALTRFVNGLLDPLQQSNFAIPLHQLAKSLQVPSSFVELRHMATHERLPSLSMLRMACTDALNWLYDNYWNKIEDVDSDLEDSDSESNDPLLSTKEQELVSQQVKIQTDVLPELIANLKVYKKIRKQDLNYVYKYGNSSETGVKYWKAVKKVKRHFTSHLPVVLKVLVFKDFMIYKEEQKSKKLTSYLNLLYKLYAPLLDEFGLVVKYQLLQLMLNSLGGTKEIVESLVNKRMGFEFNLEFEQTQASHWILHLVEDLYNQKDPLVINDVVIKKIDLIETISQQVDTVPIDYRLIILQGLKSLPVPEALQQRLKSNIDSLQKEKKLKSYEQVESLDSILGLATPEPSEPAVKKQKTQPGPFESHDNWEPVPFGSVV